jgi:hypothetical protein
MELAEEAQAKGLRATFEHWQQTIDDRIRAVLPTFSPIRELTEELRRLSERIDALEKRIDDKKE